MYTEISDYEAERLAKYHRGQRVDRIVGVVLAALVLISFALVQIGEGIW